MYVFISNKRLTYALIMFDKGEVNIDASLYELLTIIDTNIGHNNNAKILIAVICHSCTQIGRTRISFIIIDYFKRIALQDGTITSTPFLENHDQTLFKLVSNGIIVPLRNWKTTMYNTILFTSFPPSNLDDGILRSIQHESQPKWNPKASWLLYIKVPYLWQHQWCLGGREKVWFYHTRKKIFHFTQRRYTHGSLVFARFDKLNDWYHTSPKGGNQITHEWHLV